MISAIIAGGIGFNPGSTKYIATLGFSSLKILTGQVSAQINTLTSIQAAIMSAARVETIITAQLGLQTIIIAVSEC